MSNVKIDLFWDMRKKVLTAFLISITATSVFIVLSNNRAGQAFPCTNVRLGDSFLSLYVRRILIKDDSTNRYFIDGGCGLDEIVMIDFSNGWIFSKVEALHADIPENITEHELEKYLKKFGIDPKKQNDTATQFSSTLLNTSYFCKQTNFGKVRVVSMENSKN